MNMCRTLPPIPLIGGTCKSCNAFTSHSPILLILFSSRLQNGAVTKLHKCRILLRKDRFLYKCNSFRDKNDYGYWNSDGESIGEAKFKTRRSPFEDDRFDDTNPWWSSFHDDDDEEEEYGYELDDDDDINDSSQLKWGSSAVQQAFRSLTWILPAVLIPWLVGNPMGVIMALFFPFAQTAIGSLFEQAWKSILRSVAPASPKPKRKQKRTYRRGSYQSDSAYSDSFETASGGMNREQSATSNPPDVDVTGSTPPERRQKYSWTDHDRSRSDGIQDGLNLGGWEELDDGTDRPVKTIKQKKKGKLSRKMRREVPLLYRLLIALFPFLGFWGKYL